jgi:dTDP-4-dehydrorhamnose 3,5-epimerase-like enzyme
MEPKLVEGGIAVDDRGTLLFANDFLLSDFKRMYVVKNHSPKFVRAWHGHRFETKAIFVAEGTAVIGAVKVDDWEAPSKDLPVKRVVLSSLKPSIFVIPPGYANGIMTLSTNTTVCVFSSSTLSESMADDVRFPARFWDIWTIEER